MASYLSDYVPPECPIVDGVQHTGGKLEPVLSESWPADGIDEDIYRQYVTAGRRIYVQLSAAKTHADQGTISLRMYAKSLGSGRFLAVCASTINVKRSANSYFLGLQQFSTGSPTLWKLEIEDNRTTNEATGRAPISVNTLRESDPEPYSMIVQHPNDFDQYFCGESFGMGDANMKEFHADPAKLKGFSKNAVLEIRVRDAHNVLTTSQYEGFNSAILKSVLMWSHVCRDCRRGLNSLVKIRGDFFVDSGLVDHLEKLRENKSAFTTFTGAVSGEPTPDPDRWHNFFDTLNFGHTGYIPVDRSNKGIQFLCSAKENEIPQEILDLQSALGCSHRAIETTKFEIEILNDALSCDEAEPDPDIIACGKAGRIVQLNAKNYSFVSRSRTKLLFGQGDRPVEFFLVMLHEMGHWLGLGHLQSASGIMLPVFSDLECIDDTAEEALIQVLRKGPSAQNQSFGLKYGGSAARPH